MRCPVHNLEGCECAYARKFHAAMTSPTGEVPALERVTLGGKQSPGLCNPKLLALTFAGVLACSGAPEPCTPSDVSLISHEADCLARVAKECAGIPLDQPCAFEDACKSHTRERCK